MEAFWNWFQDHHKPYLFIHEVEPAEQDRLLDELLHRLHDYSDQLFFEIGSRPEEKMMELTITAEGNKKYFSSAEALVDQAPQMPDWKFVALKPPQGLDFELSYEGIDIDPKNLWFLPLEHPDRPDLIGLHIAIEDFNQLNKNGWLKAAIHKVLDTVLGEKSFALDVHYLDVVDLPEDPDGAYMLPLKELTNYIEWKKGEK